MTSVELKEIVDQRMSDSAVLGRLACNLRSSDLVEQRHTDGRTLSISWQDTGDLWRCTVFLDEKTGLRLAQIDVHENSTIRIEAFQPCSVTLSPDEGFMCLTRYKIA